MKFILVLRETDSGGYSFWSPLHPYSPLKFQQSSLKIFVNKTINVTKVLFFYEQSKEDEEYLNFISLKYKINWSEYTFYFQIFGEDNMVFEENQKTQKIRYKRLGLNYKDSLCYVIQDIVKSNNISVEFLISEKSFERARLCK